MTTKTCTKCDETKPLDAFSADKRLKSGRRADCKECNRNYMTDNKARRDEWLRRDRAADPEKYKARLSAWKAANPDRVREHEKRSYGAHRDQRAAYGRAWREEHPRYMSLHSGHTRALEAGNYAEDVLEASLLAHWSSAGIDPNSCKYCGGIANEIDHYIPISKGGPHAIGNLMPACSCCNQQKGAEYPM